MEATNTNNVIIHPTDFSDCSMVAYEYALHLAELFDCELLLIHSVDTSDQQDRHISGRKLLLQSEAMEKEAEQQLKKLGEAAIEKSLKVRAQLYSGSLTSYLPDIIKNEKPVFTVMGTTGAGSMAKKVFGSNANAIIQSSAYPVLAIPAQSKFTLPGKLVLAADLEKVNEQLLSFLNGIIGKMKSTLQFLYVVTEETTELGEQAIRELDSRIEAFEAPMNREFQLITNDDYIEGVSEHVSNENPELFSIIRSDKNFIEKFLFGSLSEKMIYHSNVPLLVLPENMH